MFPRYFLAAVLLIYAYGPASATTIFTDPTAFNAAVALLPGTSDTIDFESLTPDSTINSGDTIDGVTFNYGFGTGDLLRVSTETEAGQATTSGTQFLGTNYAGNYNLIEDAEGLDLAFSQPTIALGMFFTTLDMAFDGDFVLITPEGSVSNLVADAVLLGDGATKAYFVGIIGDQSFSTAQIRNCGSDTGCGGYFFYGVDDITTVAVVPEPTTITLFGAGLLGLGLIGLRKRTQTKNQ